MWKRKFVVGLFLLSAKSFVVSAYDERRGGCQQKVIGHQDVCKIEKENMRIILRYVELPGASE